MLADEYQALALRTIVAKTQDQHLLEAVLGLIGETGEIADALKKHLYQGHPLDPDAMVEELGDVLWYLSYLLHRFETPLSVAMERNLEKQRQRYPDGFDPERSLYRSLGGPRC